MNRIKMKYFSVLLLIGFFIQSHLEGQWKSINPGAGGQVQDVVGDPGNPGILYLASDMEGVYRSKDNGESWEITGQLMHNRVYAVTVDPGNSDRLYVGTLYGLHISDNAGENYDFVFSTRGKSIGSIAVDPSNSDNIIAGPGWRDDYDFIGRLGEQKNGIGLVFLSEDGGITWDEYIFDNNTGTDRNVWNISYDLTDPSVVYIGTGKGIFKSIDGGKNWTQLENPSGVTYNRGVGLSPDGTTLYAAYNAPGKLYISPVGTIAWQEVMRGDGISLSSLNYWYPEVDSRSSGSSHKVLVGMQGQREGLFEGTFTWTGSTLDSYSWKRIWDDNGGWDRGWDYATPNARFAHYTPGSWDRAVWSTTNQTIYEGEPNGTLFSWNNKYCIPNYDFQVPTWGTTWPTYYGRGTESTYTYDITVHDNYVLQGQGDNGFMESWDYGFSWSNMQHRQSGINLSDVQAVDVADAWGTPLVVAQATSGYGGSATDGRLYVKELIDHAPTDDWILLGAGPSKLLGIPDGILRDIAVSPANPAKVFAFSSHYGMYLIEDIGRTLAYRAEGKSLNAVQIDNGVTKDCGSAKKISPHPTNEDIVFFNSTSGVQGVFKGVYDGETWNWSKIYDGYGWDSEVHCWEHEGQVYLMYAGFASGTQGDGEHTIVALSLDEGESWEIIFNKEKAMELRMPEWYDEWKDIYTFQTKGGPAASGNTIVVNYYHHGYQLGYGIFRGTIQPDQSIVWEDWTGDLHFPGPTTSIFAETNDSSFFYTTTAGAGAWVRTIGLAEELPEAPNAPADPSAKALFSNKIEISWSDLADNETGFRIERKTETGDFEIIGQVGKNKTIYTDFDLLQLTTYTYRIMAFNDRGISGYSSEVSETTLEGSEQPCEYPNLLVNGDFEDNLDGWILYTNSGAVATAERSDEPGFVGEGSAKVSITTAPTSGSDNDIQFYSPFEDLEADESYKVSFKAKASMNESLRFQILLNQSPWTSFVNETITLTTEVQDYGPFSFYISENIDNVRIDFFLGKSAIDFWVDTVVIKNSGQCITGAAENFNDSEENSFHLYPNPLKAGSDLSLVMNESGTLSLKLISLTGQVLFKTERMVSHNEVIHIQTDVLRQKGIYVLNIMHNQKLGSKKLIVN